MGGASQTWTPRKDQVRNRQRLIEAAREAFVERGPDVQLEEIARRAGLAASSLYRHFPSKDDLIEAVLDELIRPMQEAADLAAQIPDPQEAFRTMFTRSCTIPEAQGDTFTKLAFVNSRTLDYAHRLVRDVVAPGTTRLHAAGGLRDDITVDDVAMFLRMTTVTETSEQRRRALDVLLAGMLSTPPH